MNKRIIILFFVIAFVSCTKKYDWTCTCEVYGQTSTTVETKEIKDVRKPDADRICAKFGEDVSPNNTAHECSVK